MVVVGVENHVGTPIISLMMMRLVVKKPPTLFVPKNCGFSIFPAHGKIKLAPKYREGCIFPE